MVLSELRSRPGLRSVSWVHMSSWSGSFALLGRWNVESQVSTQPRPTAGTMAGTNLAQLPRKEGGRAQCRLVRRVPPGEGVIVALSLMFPGEWGHAGCGVVA